VARDPAREVALTALRAVRERDAYANLVLPGLLRSRSLDPQAAARATDLVYGTLRGLGVYDEIIAACSTRPLDDVDPDVLDALRLGAHQVLTGRTPAYAAVSTTVDAVRRRRGTGPSRFVNAVLRHLAGTDLDGWAGRLAPDPDTDVVGHLAFVHTHPRWVVTALLAALDGDVSRLASVLAADNTPPEVTLAALPGRCERDELPARPGRWATTAARLPGGDPAGITAVVAGRARVQDEGSQLVTLALVEAAGTAGPWLDMCAGPGGKTTLLAALLGPSGHVLAAELHDHRARLVATALQKAGLTPRAGVVQADATSAPWGPGWATGVLLDAPCTGLGALRRRPEARWRRRPDDLGRLVPLQRRLLEVALDSVRPGGTVGYVTCSPHPAETVEVVAWLREHRDDVETLDAPAVVPHVPQAARGPYLQLWPDVHGTDAMFLALLRRSGEAGCSQ